MSWLYGCCFTDLGHDIIKLGLKWRELALKWGQAWPKPILTDATDAKNSEGPPILHLSSCVFKPFWYYIEF